MGRPTHWAWKSTRTGSWLLMTRSVKSSWSCTLKETPRRGAWWRGRGNAAGGEEPVRSSGEEEGRKEVVAL